MNPSSTVFLRCSRTGLCRETDWNITTSIPTPLNRRVHLKLFLSVTVGGYKSLDFLHVLSFNAKTSANHLQISETFKETWKTANLYEDASCKKTTN